MAHIPDGFVSAPVAATTLVAAGAIAAYAARRAQGHLDERAAPTLGLATAAVFAAQTLNFPVAAGTSGHLLGGVLLAVIFGPWAAYLVMVAVLIVQALIFADGGLTALGANILNIGGAGALFGYAVYRALLGLSGDGPRRRGAAAAAAAFLATVLTGAAAGVELGLSAVAPTRLAVSAMTGVHVFIGVVEAAITGPTVWALARKRPDLVYRPQAVLSVGPARAVALAALSTVAIVAGALSLIASAAPDSMERVAIDLGFAQAAADWDGALFPGYRTWLPGPAGTFVAVVFGVALLFAGALGLARALAHTRRPR